MTGSGSVPAGLSLSAVVSPFWPRVAMRDQATETVIRLRRPRTAKTRSVASIATRNRYTIDPTVALRHPTEADHPVGDLLATFLHREDTPATDQERRLMADHHRGRATQW